MLAKVETHHIHHIASLVKHYSTDKEQLERCAKDETEDLHFLPQMVVQPQTVQEVQAVLRYCNENSLAVTPRGAGTGLSGGALPVHSGIVIEMNRMNQILFIDTDNFQVTVEPGVITQVLMDEVKAKGMYYPVDPASKGSCFIGGNVAENSGGPRATKYGCVKDYVLNLEIVLPSGERIWTGANTLKNATGYNLTQLLVGSEGTLGIITKIVLKLLPIVKHDVLMLVPFKSATEACQAVNAVFKAGYSPSALEFMERNALLWSIRYAGWEDKMNIPDEVQAHLLIELDGQDADQLMLDAEGIYGIMSEFDTGDIQLAESYEQKQNLWTLRRKVGEAVKSRSIYKEEDTVVPRSRLPELLQIVKDLGKRYGFESVCYGHAGDGNLHINIVKGDLTDPQWNEELPIAITTLFQEVVRLNGTISGEHGIGWVQKNYMPIAFDPMVLALMKQIKNTFDPKGILNPGKVFPEFRSSRQELGS